MTTTPDVPRTTRIEVTESEEPSGWREYLAGHGEAGFLVRPEWLRVLRDGLGQRAIGLTARDAGRIVGVLPVSLVSGPLFGRFLVSLPYVNTAGVVADSEEAACALIDRAVALAERFDVRYLELRHEREVVHPRLTPGATEKVHMRLALPSDAEALWDAVGAKVRNQVRKGEKVEGLEVAWHGAEGLDAFHDVFCRNMRDLGTPPFSKRLFGSILREFAGESELCVLRLGGRAIAAALLLHGPGTTQVPSASSLRSFNATNANMLMYWQLLKRSVERGQRTFDFGRSTKDGGTYRFKKQWGATESPAVWQHCVRSGGVRDLRPDGGKFDLAIRAWQKLPVWVTKLIGPSIVRGIP